jgi:hypothetical protein
MKTKSIITTTVWLATVIASRFIKVNMLIGSSRLMLSGLTITLPIIGNMFPTAQALFMIAALACGKGLAGILPFTLWLPSLCAALSWSISNKNNILDFVINVILPTTCMFTFITHPIAGNAAVYSAYWIIPPAVFALRRIQKKSGLFLISLQSTFVAHAVGSIIWLYMIPMTATQWLQLIPLVAIERLTLASASVLVVVALGYMVKQAQGIAIKVRNTKIIECMF